MLYKPPTRSRIQGEEMSITSVSGATASLVQSSSDTASLEQQLRALEQALQAAKQGKGDEKTKTHIIKELEAQSAKGGVSSQSRRPAPPPCRWGPHNPPRPRGFSIRWPEPADGVPPRVQETGQYGWKPAPALQEPKGS